MVLVSCSTLLLLLLSLSCYCEAKISKRLSKRDDHFERTDLTNGKHSISDIHNRLRRATSDPDYKLTLLNDTNANGLVHYSGNDSKVVFVLTYAQDQSNKIINSNVYRSNDYGYTFTNINTNVSNGATLANRIFISPEDPKRVYFADASQSVLYLSTDEGVTFMKRSLVPSSIDPLSLLIHPTVEDWVLGHDTVNNALYVSRDFGKTAFKKIADNVFFASDYQWGEAPYDQDNTIVYYNTDSSNGKTEVDLYTQHYPYDDTTKKEFDHSLGPHDGFVVVDRYIFVQKTINDIITLWVSADRKPFKQAMIPSNYEHLSFLVDSIRSLQALVIVYHSNYQFNLYMSEENGVLYYLALSDLSVDPQTGAIDLETIASMNYTTYIANQNIRDTPDDQNPVLRTLISFDVGANWNILTPPTDTSLECIQPLCSLHLHMSTSEYWRTGIYSQESAPGIIIAHGATGQSLTDANTNLFISRDGGSSWSMTLNGTWGVSVLDRGGLIVAARDFHNGVDESRTLKYTCNEGMSWSDLTFTTDKVRVFAVLTEPGESTTVASLFGIESSGWAVVTVNFSNVFPRMCKDEDYYNWVPFDQNTDTGCLLGAEVSIKRQKPSSCCLNGKTYNKEVSYDVCVCSEEDFECDYGYKHANGYSGPCIRDKSITIDNPCSNGDLTYMESQGYYKIGGDVCSGGDESNYVATEVPCCLFDSSSSSNKMSIVLGCFVLIAIIIIGIFAAVFIVCIVKHYKAKRTSAYRVVPPAYVASSPDNTPTTAGVQNVNFQDDDDDDKPLAP